MSRSETQRASLAIEKARERFSQRRGIMIGAAVNFLVDGGGEQ
jgi:hypothetical protein